MIAEARFISGLLCVAVLATILTLGLWPFHVPANEVAWLKDRAGLGFGGDGSAISSNPLPAPAPTESGSAVEIWLRPARVWDSGTFLTFCSSENPSRLLVRQSQTNLEIQAGKDDRQGSGAASLYANDVFRKPGPAFITITSGKHRTSMYLDGTLVRTAQYQLPTERFAGRVVVGDSTGQTDSWRGQLFGLAIYHRELPPQEVARHYLAWTRQARPQTTRDERNVALYLFDERAGSVAHNSAAPGLDLRIPAKYTVLDKIVLEPFWREFSMSRSYWSAALKNIVGFVPLGFCFSAYLTALRVRRAGLVTVLLGTMVSVTIEILQAYLPTRDSGTTDIITNALGTWIGVASFSAVVTILGGTFPAVLLRISPHRLECSTPVHGEHN